MERKEEEVPPRTSLDSSTRPVSTVPSGVLAKNVPSRREGSGSGSGSKSPPSELHNGPTNGHPNGHPNGPPKVFKIYKNI